MIRRGSWFGVPALLLLSAVPASVLGSATNPHGPLTVDCAVCHTEQSWKMTGGPAGFDHAETDFPLEGLHRHAACRQCHKDLVFSRVGVNCVDCHADFHKGQVGVSCAECHTPQGWVDRPEQRRKHDETALPLVGAHERIDCDACHFGQAAADFARTPSACIACHAEQYAATANPPHQASGIGTDCIQCHGVFSATWGPGDFVHSPQFPLTGGHDGVECSACHTSGFEPLSRECQACHLEDFNATTDPDHVASAFPLDCAQCHQTSGWEPATLDHDLTAFPLTGEHTSVACASCHTSGYTGTATECQACHLDDYNDTDDPDHAGSQFPLDCAQCHQTSGWEPATLDHDLTAFPLTGEHTSVACASCHTSGYTGTATECQACHLDDYNGVTDPNHVTSGFPLDCAQCHQTSGWDGATLDHDLTAFPLTGEHTTVACASCHTSGYTGTATECQACHLDDYNGTTDPDHAGSQFPLDCAQCHQTSGWEPATLDHDLTAFPLTGEHTTVACASCHTSGYTGTATECQACHLDDYNGVTDPNHVTSGFPLDCAQCHQTNGWDGATIDHAQTAFPLTGEHVTVACASCHTSGYTGTATECQACHLDDYNGTTDPDHAGSQFPLDCAQCHQTSGWDRATIDHAQTAFPLTGEHVTVTCASCHTSGYTGTATECQACHLDDYNGTIDPDHAGSQFPLDCAQCHQTSGWDGAQVNHDLTAFPLTGQHTTVACASCHTSGYTGTATECQACHLDDYNGTIDPDHAASQFPLDCAQCHQTSGWDGAQVNHDLTAFPLTGQHTTVACASCHTSGYTGTATECQACHLDDYNGTIDPDHAASQFPLDCAQCHQTSGWDGAQVNHDLTAFPLTGQHTTVACASCHTSGYTGTPTECQACHLDDYNGVADPNHVTSGFPLDCAQCHQTTGWGGATIDHNQTGFPLTGQHTTVACASCHTSGYTGTATECQACHLNDYNGVTDPNHVTSGFPLDCTLCHQTGGWEPAANDHDQTGFPLTGQHTTVACISCHGSGYTGTPTECQACHLDDYNGVADPNHVTSGFPLDCTQCHQTSGWLPSTLDHNQTAFPLTGQHTTVACISCHGSGYTGTPTECQACHLDDFNGVADPNHVTSGFPLDCTQCHQTSGWLPSTLDHNQTAFPLTGQHTTVACISCHGSGYTGTPTECQACHLDDFNGVADPNHVTSGFPLDCTQCHQTSGWLPSTLDHNQTAFPLTGQHTTVACISCHGSGYTGTPTECQACHLDDFNGVADPNHVTSGFPLDCALCHQTSGWDGATIDHNQTGFPLTGEHTTVACIGCHGSGYTGTPTECQACHLDDYNGVADPHHVTSGFPLDCALCHQTSGWGGATIDHNQTGFPLTGQHTTVACIGCHGSGYTGTPTECQACHLDDYNGAADPNHAAAGFPLDCAGCHATSGWSPSTFDHDPLFPILTGTHRGKWNSCTDCHMVPTDFSTFECIFCHEHNQTDTNNDHREVGGYQYSSPACFFCHPRGNS